MGWPKLVPLDPSTVSWRQSTVAPVGFASPESIKSSQQDPIAMSHAREDSSNEIDIVEYSLADGAGEVSTPLGECFGLVEGKVRKADIRTDFTTQVPNHFPVKAPNSSTPPLRSYKGLSSGWQRGHNATRPDTAWITPARLHEPYKTSSHGQPRRSLLSSSAKTLITTPIGGSKACPQGIGSEAVQQPLTPTAMVPRSIEAIKSPSMQSPVPSPSSIDDLQIQDWPKSGSFGAITTTAESTLGAIHPETQSCQTDKDIIIYTESPVGDSTRSVQAHVFPKSVKHNVKSNRSGIKRIQVTVTFEGAADVTINATSEPADEKEDHAEGSL